MYWKYVIKRLINGVVIFAILVFIYSVIFNAQLEQTVYSLIEDRVRAEEMALSTGNMTPQQIEQYSKDRRAHYYRIYNLDKSPMERVFYATANSLVFNFGDSTIIKSSSGSMNVKTIVFETIPRTLLLFATAAVLDIFIGLLLGIKKAQKPGSGLDKTTSVSTMIVFGMPSWWLGMLMMMLFVYTVPIFPSGGMVSSPPPEGGFAMFGDLLYHLALPVITLVVLGFWGRAFITRNIVLGTLQEDFIMSARARGIPERKVLYGHAMRTAAPPIVTMSLLALLSSISGNIVFEGIFSWPGMGNLYWVAVEQNDIPVLMGDLTTTTMVYLGGLVLLDLIYGFLDPRIKVGGKE